MFIPENKILEILNRADIVEVISESVVLKKSGRDFFGICPFHNEKTPSFSVSAHKKMFYCFGCGAGGNVITFLMKHHGISFPEAVTMLARKYSIEIETGPVNPEVKKKMVLREGLFRLNARVMDYFSNTLKHSTRAELARAYLRQRKISQETIDLFHIGFAKDAWDGLVDFFRQEKTGKQLAEASGLVLPRKQGSGYYDRFRNRIIFPIFDINMQVAGFGGRVMDDAMPKYLNSPETPVYSKSRILYGLHQSKTFCRQQEHVFIVEGYFDFISLYQNGIKNAVATLGTALTEEHVRILKGYALKMVLVFDSDAAGVNAARRSVGIFARHGVDLRILVLPRGMDPDAFVSEFGREAFEALAEKAVGVIPFLMVLAVEKHGLSIEGKIKIIDEITPRLAEVEDRAARSLYIRDISQRLGVDETAVLEKVRRFQPGNTAAEDNGRANNITGLNSDKREMQMISMMLQCPEIRKKIIERHILDFFYSDRLAQLGKRVARSDKAGHELVAELMACAEDSGDQELIAGIAVMEVPGADNLYEKSVSLMNRIAKIRSRTDNNLADKIRKAEQGGNLKLSLELLARRQMEVRKLHGYEKQ